MSQKNVNLKGVEGKEEEEGEPSLTLNLLDLAYI